MMDNPGRFDPAYQRDAALADAINQQHRGVLASIAEHATDVKGAIQHAAVRVMAAESSRVGTWGLVIVSTVLAVKS